MMVDEGELARVFAWRLELALGAGCSYEDAMRVAESGADVHRLVEMVKAGCDPAIAVRILV